MRLLSLESRRPELRAWQDCSGERGSMAGASGVFR